MKDKKSKSEILKKKINRLHLLHSGKDKTANTIGYSWGS